MTRRGRTTRAERVRIVGDLHRQRRGHTAFRDGAVPKARAPEARPSRAAQALALAHHVQRAIHEGRAQSRADVARALGFTRGRMTQILDLLLLAPDIQEEILKSVAEAPLGRDRVSERGLRDVVKHADWEGQRAAWGKIRHGPSL